MTLRLRKTFLGCAIMAALMGVTSCSSYKSALYMQEAEQFNENSKSQLYDFRIIPRLAPRDLLCTCLFKLVFLPSSRHCGKLRKFFILFRNFL